MSQELTRLREALARSTRTAANGTSTAQSPFTPPAVLDEVLLLLEGGGGLVRGGVELADPDGNRYFLVGLSAIDGDDVLD